MHSDAGRVYPQVSKIRDVSLDVATAVAAAALARGDALLEDPPPTAAGLRAHCAAEMYDPWAADPREEE